MPRRADAAGDPRYLLRFGITAFLLISGTLVLVLYVLPERYVLSSGFRESGMTFPEPGTPFVPGPVVRTAARPVPQPPAVILPGPAEIFWQELTPLLGEERYAESLPLFQDYLSRYPSDRDVRREYAVTLLAMDRRADAVPELRRLLAEREDFDQRLFLARTLRELGRVDEASEEYEALVELRPRDADLWLEWARALAWAERYAEAVTVLREALVLHPESAALAVELARAEFSRDDPVAAYAALYGLSDASLAAEDALSLRAAVVAALPVPEDSVALPPPTLLEQAVAAREEDDFERSAELFEAALAERPGDPEIWQAYADFLEYELGDLEQAHAALLEVERLGASDPALQHRLAQLEIWAGRNEEARARLLALLPVVESDPDAAAPVTSADVRAMLGDLERWDGDRIAAASQYERALETDAANERALAGLSELEREVARTLVEVEEPRVGAASYAAADTDDFNRLDVGGEWIEVQDDWTWGGSAGNRWLDGRGYDGLPAEHRGGVYMDLALARWWRWGTLRSAAHVGFERLRDTWDPSLGGSLTHRGTDGSQSEVRYEHGPAYPTTATLQSAVAGVVQDHVTVSHARQLSDRWTVSIVADGAYLRTDLDTIPNARNESTSRLQGALSFGRQMSETVTLGLGTRAMGYTSSGPVVTDPVTSLDQRLFWDPRLAVSAGPFARLRRDLSSTWRLTGSLSPGIAFIDERTSAGGDVVPHVSAEAGIRRQGSRFWTSLDLFFYQGQFDGYRLFGARLSVSARDLSSLGGGQ